jgi:DNA ligase (NAD+)
MFDLEVNHNNYSEVVRLYTEATKSYYNNGLRIMSDLEFDRVRERLETYEMKNISDEEKRVTSRLGSITENKGMFPIVKQQTPMLSIDTLYLVEDRSSPKDFGKFYFKQKRIGEAIITPKLDGRSCKAVYSLVTGKLVHLLTRYRNDEGQDISRLMGLINYLPQEIDVSRFPSNEAGYIEIVGELVISKENFNTFLNKEFKTPLSALGVLNSNDPVRLEKVKGLIDFVVHSPTFNEFQADVFKTYQTFFKAVGKLSQEFKKVPFDIVKVEGIFNFEEIRGVIKSKLSYYTSDFEYNCDGVIYAPNDLSKIVELKHNSRVWRGLIAVKPVIEDYTPVKVENIEWRTGRTGLISPVVSFEPVEINEKTYSKATLHNVAFVREHDIGVGSILKLIVANGIIPKILGKVGSAGKAETPSKCADCNEDLVEVENAQSDYNNLMCVNPSCPAKSLSRIVKSASKNALDIKGLSKSKIETLVEHGLIETTSDLFKLKHKRAELLELPRWGEKSVDNLLQSIEDVRGKKVKPDKFINALDIGTSFSKSGSKKLVESGLFSSFMSDFLMIEPDEIRTIGGFGQKAQKEWENFMNNPSAIEEAKRLIYEVNPIDPREDSSDSSESSESSEFSVYVSGKLKGTTKAKWFELFNEQTGGKFKLAKTFTKKVDLLVYVTPNSKSGKVSYKIYSLDEFLKLKEKLPNLQMKIALSDLNLGIIES